MNTMDYEYEQWMWEGEEQGLFSSFPLLEQKAGAGIQDGADVSDLISPAGNLLDQLDAMYPTDKEIFPDWMSEKMSLNFLEEIQELSNEATADPPPALLPLEKFTMEEKEEKSELTDLDILNQLVAYSATNMQPLQITPEVVTPGDALTVTGLTDEVEDELWEALSAASGLSSPASSDDMSFLGGSPAASSDDMSFMGASPASSEDMDVFITGFPASAEDVAVLPVIICPPVPDSINQTCSLPPVQSMTTKPSKSKARSVLKTVRGTVKPSRKERKKDQNKQAATRYREKKRSQTVAASSELDGLEKRNEELKDTVESMTKEIKYLKDLLQEVLAVKGKLKEMGHTKA